MGERVALEVGQSSAAWGGGRWVYLSVGAQPSAPTPREQAELLLGRAGDALRAAGARWDSVLRVTAFLDPLAEPAKLRAALSAGLDALLAPPPATAWLLQAPLGCGPGAMALELDAWVPPPGSPSRATSVVRRGPRSAWLELGPERRVLLSGVSAAAVGADLGQQAWGALTEAEALLAQAGLGLDNVVRTWLYVPRILALDPGGGQHYQLVNEARARFFARPGAATPLGALLPPAAGGAAGRAYPASTGIGVAAGALTVDLEAVSGPPGQTWAVPLENPHQRPASAYPGQVLAGGEGSARPLFSRALLEVGAAGRRLHVSGTASIRGAQTCHVGRPGPQADLTLDNIEALLAEPPQDDTSASPLGGLDGLRRLRVYVKRAEDHAAVRAVVRRRCGQEVPCLFVQADVCREDLLVEIEAVSCGARRA